MRVFLAITLLLLGCRDNRPASRPAADPPPAVAPQADPWAVLPSPDDPPSLEERVRVIAQACPAVTAPYFYRIEKAGKVSHILGTRHISVSLAKFPQVVHDRLAAAKLVVFEVAPGDHGGAEPPELALREELGPALWERYRTLVGTRVAQAFERAAPSAAVLAMMVMHEDTTAMLDSEIEQRVVEAKVPTRGLETGEFQAQLIERFFDLRMLRAVIEETADRRELAEVSRKDITEYCAGTDNVPGFDDEARRDLLAAGFTSAEIEKLDEMLLYERNADWIPKLEDILSRGDAFIVVGADHLTGARGVIALLAARGYTTSRVKPS